MAPFFFVACPTAAAAVVALGTAAAPPDPTADTQYVYGTHVLGAGADADAGAAGQGPPPAPPAAFRFASSQGNNMVLQVRKRVALGFVGLRRTPVREGTRNTAR